MNRLFCLSFTLILLTAAGLRADVSKDSLEGPPQNAPQEFADTEEAATVAAKLEKADDHYSKGKYHSAKRLLKRIIKRHPKSPLAADALLLRAQIYKENERWYKSFNDLQRIKAEHPYYENFNRVINDQFNCANQLMAGARGKILWVFPGLKQYNKAISQFEQIISNAPYSDIAPLALMNIALLSENTGNTENAIDALDRLINDYPQSVLAPEAYFNLAQIYSGLVKGYEYDQGSTRRAISYYEDFLVLFPNSEYTGEVEANLKKMENLLAKSRLYLADFYYYYRNNDTAALVFYNEAITVAPNSDAADEARLRIEDIEKGVRPISQANILRKLLRAE